jgi:hypothetical protein
MNEGIMRVLPPVDLSLRKAICGAWEMSMWGSGAARSLGKALDNPFIIRYNYYYME